MTASLGPELRRRREAAGLTQGAVATRLGVKRPTLSQWESGRHRPSLEHLTRLDELYDARGALLDLVETPDEEPARRLTLAELFRDVGDALVGHLVVDDDGAPLGWSHHLPDRKATPLSTAFALRTLHMLDQATRVDVHALAAQLRARHTERGWTNRPGRVKPETTAAVLTAMAQLGQVEHMDRELERLEASMDKFALSRPYVVSVVLQCVLAIRPDAPFAERLIKTLLDARTPTPRGPLWTLDASADPDLVQPSLAHTARAATVLRQVRASSHLAEVQDAIGTALAWIVDPGASDDGITEILGFDPTDHSGDVPVHHFTSAWTLRALAGIDEIPPMRRQTALDVLWDCYTKQGLWAWRSDGSLPSWMTHDAISALRVNAFSTSLTPLTSIS